jgi:hypothetical protein
MTYTNAKQAPAIAIAARSYISAPSCRPKPAAGHLSWRPRYDRAAERRLKIAAARLKKT